MWVLRSRCRASPCAARARETVRGRFSLLESNTQNFARSFKRAKSEPALVRRAHAGGLRSKPTVSANK